MMMMTVMLMTTMGIESKSRGHYLEADPSGRTLGVVVDDHITREALERLTLDIVAEVLESRDTMTTTTTTATMTTSTTTTMNRGTGLLHTHSLCDGQIEAKGGGLSLSLTHTQLYDFRFLSLYLSLSLVQTPRVFVPLSTGRDCLNSRIWGRRRPNRGSQFDVSQATAHPALGLSRAVPY